MRNVDIRQVCHQDEQDLAHFFQKAYRERSRYKYPERWHWLYINNPFIPSGFGIPAWIAFVDGEIVGHTGAMFCPCKIGEIIYPAAWSVDTIVLPEYRGKGVGKRLQHANQDAHEVFMSLSMSDVNRAIKKKLGAFDGPEVTLYLRTKRIDSNALFLGLKLKLEDALGFGVGSKLFDAFRLTGIPEIFAKMIEFRLRPRQAGPKMEAQNGVAFKEVAGRFGPEWDALWRTLSLHYNFAVERNSTYMNWKYVDQPFMNYERFYVYLDKKLVGLLIIRHGRPPEHPLGVVAELITSPEFNTLPESIISYARHLFTSDRVNGIFCAVSLPEHHSTLRAHGFLPISKERVMLFCRNGSSRKEDWHALLAKGDHDWDQFPLLRQLSLTEVRRLSSSS